jgi:hypothetical protein
MLSTPNFIVCRPIWYAVWGFSVQPEHYPAHYRIQAVKVTAEGPMRQPGTGQTRRRGAALEAAILRAAVEQLTESGSRI